MPTPIFGAPCWWRCPVRWVDPPSCRALDVECQRRSRARRLAAILYVDNLSNTRGVTTMIPPAAEGPAKTSTGCRGRARWGSACATSSDRRSLELQTLGSTSAARRSRLERAVAGSVSARTTDVEPARPRARMLSRHRSAHAQRQTIDPFVRHLRLDDIRPPRAIMSRSVSSIPYTCVKRSGPACTNICAMAARPHVALPCRRGR